MKTKKFDAVKMMRDIRNQLHKRYSANEELREKDLNKVRKDKERRYVKAEP
jgi:hypothetical protein